MHKPNKGLKSVSIRVNESPTDLIKNTYFNHRGRLSRSQFLIALVSLELVTFLIGLLCTSLFFLGPLKYIVLIGCALACVYGSFVVIIKRLHDIDLTGWFSVIIYIPVLNLFFFFYLLLKKGDEGKNQFGFPP